MLAYSGPPRLRIVPVLAPVTTASVEEKNYARTADKKGRGSPKSATPKPAKPKKTKKVAKPTRDEYYDLMRERGRAQMIASMLECFAGRTEMTTKGIQDQLGIQRISAHQRVASWRKAGLVEYVGRPVGSGKVWRLTEAAK
jgi:hypothetical protein